MPKVRFPFSAFSLFARANQHEPEILTNLELVVNTVNMEDAVQQPLDVEATEPMGDTANEGSTHAAPA